MVFKKQLPKDPPSKTKQGAPKMKIVVDAPNAKKLTFREQVAALIAMAKSDSVPLEEIQSALHSETDIIDAEFKAAVEATKG